MSHPPPNPVPTKPPLGLYGGNILVAAPTNWDEACFSAPAVRAIRLARTACTLGVVCPEEQVTFWKRFKKIDQVIGYGAGTSYRDMLCKQQMSSIKWESAILWERNAGAELAMDLKIKQRIGYPAKNLRKWLTDEVILEPIHRAPEHRVQYYLDMMTRLKIAVNQPEIFQPVTSLTIRKNPGILLSPESDYGTTYEWGEDEWRELLGILREKISLPLRIINHPKSKTGLAARLAKEMTYVEYERMEHLGDAISIVAGSAIAVCADSSFCHIAAYAGATVMALFGPGDPNWRRPLGKHHGVIRRKVECSPCLLAKCPLDLRCQKELSVKKVADEIVAKYHEMTGSK